MDRPSTIRKTAADLRLPPNLSDYAAQRRTFSWEDARREMQGLPGGGLNIAHEAVDRHAHGELREKVAFRFLHAGGPAHDVTFGQLESLTNRFANVLRSLGVGKGDRVFVLAGRIARALRRDARRLKNGSVVTPLFSAFGPEPIATRVNIGEGSVLVTTDVALPAQDREDPRPDAVAEARHRRARGRRGLVRPGTLDLATLMKGASETLRDRTDRAGRHVAAALHQRHHRHAQGRGARARRRGARTAPPVGTRSTCIRRTVTGAPRIRAG